VLSRARDIDKRGDAALHREVKWRNRLLALFCLVVFAALGVLYFQNWVVQKPFAIILFIGEGLSPRQLAATRLYVGGADARLSLDSMPHVALLMNASKDFAVPDQAAAATALATGVKVNNHSLGIDANGQPLSTTIELARQHGRATGLVTDSRLTSPVSAAFYSHASDVDDSDSIARELTEEQKIDIVMGGGVSDFLPTAKGGRRKDNRDLLLDLRSSGYDVARTRLELENVPAWQNARLFGAFAGEELAFADQLEQTSEQPALSDMVRRAIELLQYNRRGYFLVVDAGLMRKAAMQNNAERTLRAIAEFDRAIATARRYAGARSTIIVCGDVAVGGMSINGKPFRRDSGVALLGVNAGGNPWITWATGPNGAAVFGGAKLSDEKSTQHATDAAQNEPAAFYLEEALSTAEDVLAAGSGQGTDALRGVAENTLIFRLVRDDL
jgi:alkaline phosphatase